MLEITIKISSVRPT